MQGTVSCERDVLKMSVYIYASCSAHSLRTPWCLTALQGLVQVLSYGYIYTLLWCLAKVFTPLWLFNCFVTLRPVI